MRVGFYGVMFIRLTGGDAEACLLSRLSAAGMRRFAVGGGGSDAAVWHQFKLCAWRGCAKHHPSCQPTLSF